MTLKLNPTHDPAAQSWVESANASGCDFPIQNLPFAVFRRDGSEEPWRGGVAIGDQVLDLAAVVAAGGLGESALQALTAAAAQTLNGLMALGPGAWSALREALFRALLEASADAERLRGALVPQAEVAYALPAVIGDFTDFYTSIHHATAVGVMLRPQSPLMPNYKWVPVAYHGRSSSIAVSGQSFPRPVGQRRVGDAETPTVGPSSRLDYELELGFFVGPGNAQGHPVKTAEAPDHVFGACILNDWSARDIQTWEYQPLGPFLGKNFATTISPWIVTLEALAPFRLPATRDAGDPAPLPHLDLGDDKDIGAIDVKMDVALQSAAMQAAGRPPTQLSASNYRYAYWTFQQMVAHHTSNGCNLRPGDLLGTGTLSGPGPHEQGSILEATQGGKAPLILPNGETRSFIEDGDTIVMHAWCEREGARRIGFGSCAGTVLPAVMG